MAGAVSETFTNLVNNTVTPIINAINSVFGASGTAHTVGLVPDPGASAGATKFLREDATWQVPATAAGVLTTAGGQTLIGGFTFEPFDLGTPTNGSTITPNPSDNLKQTVTNNVAGFTIAATAQVGDVELLVTNGASAGTITFSGFNKQFTGDTLDTTSGHLFVVFIYGLPNGNSAYIIKALQ